MLRGYFIPVQTSKQLLVTAAMVVREPKMRSAKKPNLRSRNAFGRAVNRPSSLCPCLLYQTFPGTKFLPDFCLTWYKLLVQPLFYLPDFMVQIFSGTIFLVQFLFLVQKRSGSRSASGARFAFGERVRPFPICVRGHLRCKSIDMFIPQRATHSGECEYRFCGTKFCGTKF